MGRQTRSNGKGYAANHATNVRLSPATFKHMRIQQILSRAEKEADTYLQHGPVKVLMKDGKPTGS